VVSGAGQTAPGPLSGFSSAPDSRIVARLRQADEVKKCRTEGETLHKAGKHQESVDTLAKAMQILDIK
jgi:hypothetical protein